MDPIKDAGSAASKQARSASGFPRDDGATTTTGTAATTATATT